MKAQIIPDFNGCIYPRNYSWPDFNNTLQVKLVKGLNAVFITGRSKGIGIYRFAVFKSNRDKALNPKTPESTLYQGFTTALETRVPATAPRPALAGRHLRLEADTERKGKTALVVTDASGRSLLSAGHGALSLDMNALLPGLYVVRVSSEGQTKNWFFALP